MARKTCPSPFDSKAPAPKADLATDYALITAGVGATLVALIYLILI